MKFPTAFPNSYGMAVNMLRKPPHLLGEIRRWCAQLDEMRDARHRSIGDRIREIGTVPQCRVLPQHRQVLPKRNLCIRVFRVGNRLSDVSGGVAELSVVQSANESIERLVAWKQRCNAHGDTSPVLWSSMLHDEAKHPRKIHLHGQAVTRPAETQSHGLRPLVPVLLKFQRCYGR